VTRQAKAYPVHAADDRERMAMIRRTLHLVGRNGMHKYGNQDQA
jgi:protoporphyrinogen oxidase